jgi:hypothetical protein
MHPSAMECHRLRQIGRLVPIAPSYCPSERDRLARLGLLE